MLHETIEGMESGRKFIRGEKIHRGGQGIIFKLHEGRTTYAGKFPQTRWNFFAFSPESNLPDVVDPFDIINSRYRFEREAELQQIVHHQGITPVVLFDRTAVNGEPFLVTRLATSDLEMHVLLHGELPAESAYVLSETIAEALAALHNESIIFSDLKPSNVLLFKNRKGVMKGRLTDFGGAGYSDRPNTLVADKNYKAPEFDETVHSERAEFTLDQYGWAKGIVGPSFTGQLGKPNSSRVMIPKGRTIWEDVVAPIAARASAKNPAQRYPSMGELVNDLQEGRKRIIKALKKQQTILP